MDPQLGHITSNIQLQFLKYNAFKPMSVDGPYEQDKLESPMIYPGAMWPSGFMQSPDELHWQPCHNQSNWQFSPSRCNPYLASSLSDQFADMRVPFQTIWPQN